MRAGPAGAWYLVALLAVGPGATSAPGADDGVRAAAVAPYDPVRVAGDGAGSVRVDIVEEALVPAGHRFRLGFLAESADSIHADTYELRDSTAHLTLFSDGADFDGLGVGPTAAGLQPVVQTGAASHPDSTTSGWRAGGSSNVRFDSFYAGVLSVNRRRVGFPDDLAIVFDSVYVDTGQTWGGIPRNPAKFRIYALTDTGAVKLRFRFRDLRKDGTLDSLGEWVEVINSGPTVRVDSLVSWRIQLDPRGATGRPGVIPPTLADVYDLRIARPFNASDVYEFTTEGSEVGVPAEPIGVFRLAPVRPNPAAGGRPTVRFALAGGAPASLALFDAAGRLVASRDVTALGAGWHSLELGDGRSLAPGLYLVRLREGALARVTRVSVIR
jgi:hypothetical protein